MTLNDILNDEKLKNIFEDSISKTFNKFKLFTIMNKDDFSQEVALFAIRGIKNFDSERASLNTYIPLMVITCAKRMYEREGRKKILMNKNNISLDSPYSNNDSDDISFYDFIISDYNLENVSTTNIIFENILSDDSISSTQKKIIFLMLRGYDQVNIAKILCLSQPAISKQFKKVKEKIVIKYAI